MPQAQAQLPQPQSSPMPSLLDLGADTSGTAHPSLTPVQGNGLDPTIALKSSSAIPNSGLDTMASFADLQTKMTQAKTLAQTYQARVKAGQILAASPDLETGLGNLYKDPTVAPFAGEITNSIRQGMLAQTQQAGEIQKQSESGLSTVMKALPALAGSPDDATWRSITNPALATMSPTARKAVAPALESLRSSLLDGLPDDPVARQAAFRSRVAGISAASPDVMSLMVGKPGSLDLGDRIQPTMNSLTTGQVAPVGTAFPKGLAPTVVKGTGPEGQDITTLWGGAGGNGLGGGGSGRGGNAVPRPLNGAGGGSDSSPHIAPQIAPGYHFGAGNALIGPTQTDSQYNTKRTDDQVEYEKNLDDRVYNGSQLRKNIGATIDAAKSAQMGGGAEAYTKLGGALQAIGVKNPTVDKWANGSLAASQVIDKVALQNSMSQLKQQLTGVGGSRLNAQEFVAYLNKNPNLTTDPRAAAEVFQLWNQFYDRDRTEQQAYDKFKQGQSTGDAKLDHLISNGNDLSSPSAGKPDIKRWPALWNQSDYMSKFAPGGPIDTTGMKGLAAGVPSDIAAIMAKHGVKH